MALPNVSFDSDETENFTIFKDDVVDFKVTAKLAPIYDVVSSLGQYQTPDSVIGLGLAVGNGPYGLSADAKYHTGTKDMSIEGGFTFSGIGLTFSISVNVETLSFSLDSLSFGGQFIAGGYLNLLGTTLGSKISAGFGLTYEDGSLALGGNSTANLGLLVAEFGASLSATVAELHAEDVDGFKAYIDGLIGSQDYGAVGDSGSGSGDSDGPERPEGPDEADDRGLTHVFDDNGNAPPEVQPGGVSIIFPILLDLDGGGISVNSDADVSFDFDGDGYREAGAWVGPGDGFLVIDRSSDGTLTADGKIDRADELVLSLLTPDPNDTDLEALAASSAINSDRTTVVFRNDEDVTRNIQVLNKNDAGWALLRVWQDVDQDGEVDSGELKTLDQLGFTQINLAYDDGSEFSEESDNITVGLATLHGLGSFVRNGTTHHGGVGDFSLGHSNLGYKRIAIDGGYQLQFEDGKQWRYKELTSADSSANFNLTTVAYDGAVGDGRSNSLDATASARAVQIQGQGGNDTITGGESDDLLSGGVGVDRIIGGRGDDLLVIDKDDLTVSTNIRGGQGMDTLMVGSDDAVSMVLKSLEAEAGIGGAGNDTIRAEGTASTDAKMYDDVQIAGRDGDDRLYDGFGDDLLSGDGGNDSLVADEGDDVLLGGNDRDTLSSGSGDDQLYGGLGNDLLSGDTDDDYMKGDDGADTLSGGTGDDVMFGGSGNDSLHAGRGDDTLDGGGGHDTLSFWRGDAELWGRLGNDLFVLEQDGSAAHWGWSSLFGGVGDDTVRLFGKSTEWDVRHIGGNQWQLYRQKSPTEKMVIDVVDIEKITFAGGGADLVLGTFTDKNTSDSYIRKEWSDYIGDDSAVGSAVAGDYTGGFYTGGVLSGWMGDDALTGSNNGSYTDTINGGSGSDGVYGGGGSDSVVGSGGADVVNGGDGNDTVSGDEGADRVFGGEGSDSVSAGSGSDISNGGAGNDSVYGGSGADTLLGEAGADNIYGGTGADQISGGDGDDLLYGDTGYDRLYGDAGNDRLYGGAGSDYLYGGAGNDILVGDDSLGNGFNYMAGGDGDDSITGGAMDDFMSGDAGNDTLKGGDGRDVLMGGAGADFLDGGAGLTDAVSYESSNDAITVNLASSTVTGTDAVGDTLLNFEQAIGGNGKDTLTGSDGDNMLAGGAANDRLYGGLGDDDLFGGSGNDMLWGDGGVDRVYGGDGNDYLYGGTGADTLDGGDGFDTLEVTGATSGVSFDLRSISNDVGLISTNLFLNIERVVGTAYNDTILGGFEDNLLEGRDGNDALTGGAGADTLIGGAGNDTLDGGSSSDLADYSGTTAVTVNLGLTTAQATGYGTDVLTNIEDLLGGDGNDRLTGNSGDNDIEGGMGNDTLDGSTGVDTLRFSGATGVNVALWISDAQNTGYGTDVISNFENVYGGTGNDSISGNSLANVLRGDSGLDTLRGGAGTDTLNGGGEKDCLYGGSGDGVKDEFVFLSVPGTSPSSALRDVVHDFVSGIDKLNLSAIDANTALSGNQSLTFNGSTAKANSVWFAVSGSDLIVRGDVDGNTTADFEIEVKAVAALVAGDFLL